MDTNVDLPIRTTIPKVLLSVRKVLPQRTQRTQREAFPSLRTLRSLRLSSFVAARGRARVIRVDSWLKRVPRNQGRAKLLALACDGLTLFAATPTHARFHQTLWQRSTVRTLAMADLRCDVAGVRGLLSHAKIVFRRQDRAGDAGRDGPEQGRHVMDGRRQLARLCGRPVC